MFSGVFRNRLSKAKWQFKAPHRGHCQSLECTTRNYLRTPLNSYVPRGMTETTESAGLDGRAASSCAISPVPTLKLHQAKFRSQHRITPPRQRSKSYSYIFHTRGSFHQGHIQGWQLRIKCLKRKPDHMSIRCGCSRQSGRTRLSPRPQRRAGAAPWPEQHSCVTGQKGHCPATPGYSRASFHIGMQNQTRSQDVLMGREGLRRSDSHFFLFFPLECCITETPHELNRLSVFPHTPLTLHCPCIILSVTTSVSGFYSLLPITTWNEPVNFVMHPDQHFSEIRKNEDTHIAETFRTKVILLPR